ncbi:USP domain-containing protein [Plasmodiophora brassicae]
MTNDLFAILQPRKVFPQLTRRQIKELRIVFRQFDRRRVDHVSLADLEKAVKRLGLQYNFAFIRDMFAFATRGHDNHLMRGSITFEDWVEATHCRFEDMRAALSTIGTTPPRAPIERYQENGTPVDPGGLIGGLFRLKKKSTWK